MTPKKYINITVPHLGEGIEKVKLALWHITEGDTICKGDDLCELLTDKVSFNVPSPHSGTLSKKYLREEQVASIGAPLACLLLS